MVGPNVPDWLREEIHIAPYHTIIELFDFLEHPDHVAQLEAVFAEQLEKDEAMMGAEEADPFGDIPSSAWRELGL